MESGQWEDCSLSLEADSDSEDVNLQLQSERKGTEENGNQQTAEVVNSVVVISLFSLSIYKELQKTLNDSINKLNGATKRNSFRAKHWKKKIKNHFHKIATDKKVFCSLESFTIENLKYLLGTDENKTIYNEIDSTILKESIVALLKKQ